MHKSGIQKANCLDMPQMTSCFGIFQMHGLAASQNDYRKVKSGTG